LIIKTSALGDIVQAFPVLSYLRARNAGCKIDWVVEKNCAELVRKHPAVDDTIEIDTAGWRRALFSSETRKSIRFFRSQLRMNEYDHIFDLQSNIKSAWILTQTRGEKKVGFGWKTVREKPNYFFTHHHINPPYGKNIREDYLAIVQTYFSDAAPHEPEHFLFFLNEKEKRQLLGIPKGGILISLGSRWANKCIHEEGIVTVLDQIEQRPFLFVWGSQAEKEKVEKLASRFRESFVLEPLTLALLQHVMAESRLLIAMDSLPLHLCGTTKTPTLSFFGPTLASKFRPMGAQHVSIEGSCPYKIGFKKTCPKLRTCATGACLKHLNFRDKRNSDAIRQALSHFES